MTKSTAPAGPAGLNSSPSAYYLWEFPEKPVSVRLSLDVVDRLEREVLESFRAITARGSEIGGLLLGRAEAGGSFKTVVDNYELFPCDYSRGPLYLLSDEEKSRLEDLIRRKRTIPGQAVVGFFRSNTRKELVLDDEDLELFAKCLSRPEQAFLLIKPFAARASTAGIFIWEAGKVRAEASYIQFPFRRSELSKGEFAKCIVMDAPKSKESVADPADAVSSPGPKLGSRAPVLPFSLKREEDAPVPAPPLKREERAPVVAMNPKAPEEAPPALRKPVEPPAARAAVPKPAPQLPPLRSDRKEEKQDERKAETPAAPSAGTAAILERPVKKAVASAQQSAAAAAKPASPPREAAEAAAPGTPAAASDPLPPRSVFGGKKLWALFGGLSMLALAGGTLYYLKSKPGTPSALALHAAGFQLRAETSNGQLRVSWNPSSKIITAARSAVLSISDGSKSEDVPLDMTQLRAGSIMYAPLSTDVAFRLEVKDGTSGSAHSEFVRVPLTAMPDVNPAPRSNLSEANKPPLPLPPVQPLGGQAGPAPDAARIDTAPPDVPENGQPAQPKPAPKPFSLASRIHQPETTDLPEAPAVDPSVSGAAVRPAAPSRLPAPVAPPPLAGPETQVAAPAPAAMQPARTGGKVQEAKLLRRVEAIYPPMARQARVSGVVRIQATIGKDGRMKRVEALSGAPLLKQAAVDAVQKWVYSPSLLNGEPVESTTEIAVSFNLGGH